MKKGIEDMKKILALVIAALMILGMTSAFAATITIQDNGNVKVADHTFSAYQIFSGTLSTDGKTLSDIVWGAGVDGAGLLTALKADKDIGSKFTSATTAEDVAKALEGATADEMVAFSRVVAEHLGTAAKENVKGGTIEGLDDGYYFVQDTTTIGEGDAASAFIVQLIGSATLKIKTDAPSIEKKVKNHDELVSAYRDANNVGIGDTVDYQITSKVPDMTNYKKYWFVVNDTMSKGLTYNDDLVVTLDGETLEKDTDYTLTVTDAADKTKDTGIEIVFKNFIQYKDKAGADIVITYTATLNDAAVIGKNGNPNEVELIYSRNPNVEGDGEDKPDDDDVFGKTPKDIVITYSTDLKIKKVDENGDALEGVKFTVYGYGENNKASYKEEFVEDANGAYWKLTDGTYTQTAPTTLTAGKYANTSTKYKLVVSRDDTAQAITYAAKQGTTDKDGIIDVGALIANGSLPAGTYVIHEDSTLSGYNVLDHDIIVTITGKIGDNADTAATISEITTTINWNTDAEGATIDENGIITITVVNKAGAELPSTGGIGTTIFYVGGGLLVLAAIILLVTKRRMNAND